MANSALAFRLMQHIVPAVKYAKLMIAIAAEAAPCILFFVMVSSHHTRWRELEPLLRGKP